MKLRNVAVVIAAVVVVMPRSLSTINLVISDGGGFNGPWPKPSSGGRPD